MDPGLKSSFWSRHWNELGFHRHSQRLPLIISVTYSPFYCLLDFFLLNLFIKTQWTEHSVSNLLCWLFNSWPLQHNFILQKEIEFFIWGSWDKWIQWKREQYSTISYIWVIKLKNPCWLVVAGSTPGLKCWAVVGLCWWQWGPAMNCWPAQRVTLWQLGGQKTPRALSAGGRRYRTQFWKRERTTWFFLSFSVYFCESSVGI